MHHRWLATGIAVLVFGGAISPLNVYGLMFEDIKNSFHITAVQTGIIPSVTWALCFLGSPFCEYLKRYTNYRNLAILGTTLEAVSILASSFMDSFLGLLFFYGLLHGITSNFVLHGVFCILYQHFPDRNGALATGIALGGATGASLILTVMYEYLLPVGGWRVALRFTALFTAVIAIPSSCLFFGPRRDTFASMENDHRLSDTNTRSETVNMVTDFRENDHRDIDESRLEQPPMKDHDSHSTQNTGSWGAVLSHPVSWVLFLAIFLPTLAWSVYWINVVSYLDSVHVEGSCMSNILTVLPVSELFGKVGIGVLAEAIPRCYLLIGHNLLFLLVTAMYAFFPVYDVLFICSLVIGAGRGSYNVLSFSVMDQLLPITATDKAITVTMVALGIGFTLGTVPAGAIFDHAGSYTFAFVLNMIFYLLGAFLLVCVIIWKKVDESDVSSRKQRRQGMNDAAVT